LLLGGWDLSVQEVNDSHNLSVQQSELGASLKFFFLLRGINFVGLELDPGIHTENFDACGLYIDKYCFQSYHSC
jgi:hypothetical protein